MAINYMYMCFTHNLNTHAVRSGIIKLGERKKIIDFLPLCNASITLNDQIYEVIVLNAYYSYENFKRETSDTRLSFNC